MAALEVGGGVRARIEGSRIQAGLKPGERGLDPVEGVQGESLFHRFALIA